MPKELRDEIEQQRAEQPVERNQEETTVVPPPPVPSPEPVPSPPDINQPSVVPSPPSPVPPQPEIGMLNVWEGISKFFYDIFNPFLIPAYVTLLLFELSVLKLTNPMAALSYTLTVLGATCVVPVVVLVFLRKMGVISSLGMTDRNERTLPYIVSLLTLAAMTVLMVFRQAPAWVWTVYVGGCATILINLFVNYRIKVCNHASGIAAVLAMFVALQLHGLPVVQLGWWVIATVLLCGLIGTAAMVVGRHCLLDVLIGYATGFLPIVLFSLIK